MGNITTAEIALIIAGLGLLYNLLNRAWTSAKDGGSDAKTISDLNVESEKHTLALARSAELHARQDEINKHQGAFNGERTAEERRLWEALNKKQDRI